MGLGMHEKSEDEVPSEDEREAEQRRLNEHPQEGIELKKVTPTRPVEQKHPVMVIGETKPMFKTTHLKYALITFNGILSIFGLLVLILAVWIRVDPEFWEYDSTLDVSTFYVVCNMLIVAGLIVVLVAFMGCFGTVLENQWMLIAYLVIFFIIFILELAAVIMIWSAPYSSTIKKGLQKQIKKQIDQVELDDSSRYFMDFLQANLQCCGSVNQKDYDSDIPKSCRSEVTGNVHVSGCAEKMLQYLRGKAGIIGGISIPVLLFQLLAKFVCYCLIYNIRKESSYKMRD